MKFKLRADKEDWIIFGVFAVALLYIIAIAVVNLSSFASTGHFAGLNPFPAFGPDYIFPTLIFYLLTLGGLFVSAGSYFFEREKGIGITTAKKDKGYSRWAKDKEIKAELQPVLIQQRNSKAAGIPIILNEKEMWVDDTEYHSLVIGATGSGKTQTVILPQVHSLAKAKESMIITDPKGEIYEKTSNMLRARGYQILLLNFRDPQNGNAWNPMSLPYKMYKSGKQDKAIELLDDLALNILYDDSNKNADPFWEKTSADYFSGVALGLFEDAKPEEININSISLATTVGEEKFGGSTYIKEYFAAKDPASPAAIDASSTIMAPTETKGSILSVFKQKVKLFASRENLSEMLSYSDVDLESIGERPTAVFIVIQDEKKTYHSLVTILLKQIYETLISVAQRHGGKLPIRTNFLLDEFANMPPLKDVTTMITAARSRGIRFTMIIQNFAQLDSVYGKEDAETIRGNCGNIIYLITTELKALEEISKMCGEVKSKKDDKTASTPLVTVSDLQRMKQFEVIILRMRKQPFKTKFTPYFKLDWGKKYPPAKYPIRQKKKLQTFDIKEFVKAQKKQKLLEMMNGGNQERAKQPTNNKLHQLDPMAKPNMPAQKQSQYPDFLTKNLYEEEKKTMPGPIKGSGYSRGGITNDTENGYEPVLPFPNPFESGMKQPFSTPAPKEQTSISIPTPSPLAHSSELTMSTQQKPAMPVLPKQTMPIKPLPEMTQQDDSDDDDDDGDDFGFDVDELIKKIDAKMAEIEAEENKKKQNQITTPEQSKDETIIKQSIIKPVPGPATPVAIPKPETKPLEENENTMKEVRLPENDLTLSDDENDDDFFDDFFDN